MRIHLIRHGESQANVDGILCGDLDSPLSAKGERQAQQLSELVQKQGLRFDLCYVSPLERAFRTAEIVGGFKTLKVDARLKEGGTGAVTHENLKSWRAANPHFDFHGFEPRLCYPEGESLEAFDKRVEAFICEELYPQRTTSQDIAVVAHNGSLGLIFRHFFGIEIKNFPILEMPNCSVFSLEVTHYLGHYRTMLTRVRDISAL